MKEARLRPSFSASEVEKMTPEELKRAAQGELSPDDIEAIWKR